MTQIHRTIALVCCLTRVVVPAATAQTPVATYTFNNTLAAQQGGVAALTTVDPESTSGFESANVFGTTQETWNFNGLNSPASDQGGLQFNTTGLITDNDYSVEMVFELTGNSGYRRILDSLDRTSDDGLYIDPNDNLNLFPNGAGTGGPFTANTFFDVFVTVDPTNTVNGYINGVEQFSDTSTNLDINSDILGFFLDNTGGGGQGEWSSGNIALIDVFNTALTAQQVATQTADVISGSTPEPGTWLLMFGGAAGVAIRKRYC